MTRKAGHAWYSDPREGYFASRHARLGHEWARRACSMNTFLPFLALCRPMDMLNGSYDLGTNTPSRGSAIFGPHSPDRQSVTAGLPPSDGYTASKPSFVRDLDFSGTMESSGPSRHSQGASQEEPSPLPPLRTPQGQLTARCVRCGNSVLGNRSHLSHSTLVCMSPPAQASGRDTHGYLAERAAGCAHTASDGSRNSPSSICG